MVDFGFVVCNRMATAIEDVDIPLIYLAKYREFGLPYLDGGTAILVVEFCPFCGDAVPPSLRDQWFDRLEEMGLEDSDPLPAEFESDAWWRGKPEYCAPA